MVRVSMAESLLAQAWEREGLGAPMARALVRLGRRAGVRGGSSLSAADEGG
jgi:hypothetical protein